jgi:hypothetical protein
MNNSYDLHSWSKQYREERLTEARVRHTSSSGRGRAETHAGRGAAVSLLLGGTRWRCCAQ